MFFKSRLKEIEEKILAIRKDGVIDSENLDNSAKVRKTKEKPRLQL